MADYDVVSLRVADARLSQLIAQIDTALTEDFPNPDIEKAAQTLKGSTTKVLSQVRDAVDYSPPLVEQILVRVTIQLSITSYLLGVILRSTATRNPFELYHPFKDIVRAFFGAQDVFLILSSEWEYIPFTHPMNLEELPRFIVIGMPASEADNILAFPAAGHELGHSVWLHNSLSDHFRPRISDLISKRINENPRFWEELFQKYTREELDQDLFGDGLRRATLAEVQQSAVKQLEELFCDFIGIHIFGTSYLHSFRYLLSGMGVGERSKKYPDIKERAEVIDAYASELGFKSVGLARWFSGDAESRYAVDLNILRLADSVRRELTPELKSRCKKIVESTGLAPPGEAKSQTALHRFMRGVPVEAGASLGDLVCAAWDCFLGDFADHLSEGKKVGALSSLVLKSAEAIEFKSRMQVAG